MLVGRRGAHVGVDDEEHGIRQIDGHLGLGGDRCVDATRVGLPAPGVDHREPAAVPFGLVGDAVAGDTRGVLHHGFTPPEDAVDERRLAHVGPPDDRQHGQRRQVGDRVRILADRQQDVAVRFIELVVLEPGTQGRGALRGEVVVERGETLDEIVGSLRFVQFVVSHVLRGLSQSRCERHRRPRRRSARNRVQWNRRWSHRRRRS